MAQSVVDEITHRASGLSPGEKERIVAALSGAAPGPPPDRRLDAYGRFAHVPTSVGDFLLRKAAEIELEDPNPVSGDFR